jgi:hypothetical protein
MLIIFGTGLNENKSVFSYMYIENGNAACILENWKGMNTKE